jgi:thioredoxin-like negative regulator of GroEL
MSAPMVMYFFTSPACRPCKAVKPVISELQEDHPFINWAYVDVSADPNHYTTTYKVTQVPTMVAVYNGNEVGRHTGTQMMGYFALVKRLTSQGRS